jgi:phosphoribosylanthranilate isomerase
MKLKVKICGITRRDDAVAAVDAGANAVGFIFSRSSPRYIDPAKAGGIIDVLPKNVTPVGVFVNAPREEIEQAIAVSGIRCLQLHGEETVGDTGGFSLPVVKAFRVGPRFDPGALSEYMVAAFLLDTHAPDKHGGTGRVFDWNIAREAKAHGRVILSGGLNPSNVLEAIKVAEPFAIDVNSGVETRPGIKDHEKIARLFAAVRAYHANPDKEFLC